MQRVRRNAHCSSPLSPRPGAPSRTRSLLQTGARRDGGGITGVRLNEACASLVVEYDPAREPLFKELLAPLEALSAKQLAGLIAAAAAAVPQVKDKAPPPNAKSGAPLTKGDVPGLFSAQSPLNLPTLSLLMAFSTNPLVVAVNMPLMLWNAIPIAQRAWRVWSSERRLNVDFLDTLAISASVLQANPLAGSLVTWLIKLGDWIRDLTAAGSRRAIAGLLELLICSQPDLFSQAS
jgi:cation transport ATPase